MEVRFKLENLDDIKWLKKVVLRQQKANMVALKGGLEILQNTDLRQEMAELKVPVRGIYGRLDSLVPRKAIEPLSEVVKDFEYTIVKKASHAPFISHKDEFLQVFCGYFEDLIR